MKKVLNYTLYGNYNYGNKLQNLAVQNILEKYGFESHTVVFKIINYHTVVNFIKKVIKRILRKDIKDRKRLNNFVAFDKNIRKIKYRKIRKKENDFIVIGSDQVWNPYDYMSRAIVRKINKEKRISKISLAASISSDNIPTEYLKDYVQHFKSIKDISVRENEGKELIKKYTKRDDVTVLSDPTILVEKTIWDNYAKEPEMMKKDQKFILTYFLGEMSDKRKKEINRIAEKNDCIIIDIMNKESEFYECGPQEFLWLEKNAFLICTDSFHSSVFALLFNRPFIVYDREQKGINNMSSRINTFLEKFQLKDRKYTGELDEKYLICDYTKAYEIVKNEKMQADKFLKNALKIKT